MPACGCGVELCPGTWQVSPWLCPDALADVEQAGRLLQPGHSELLGCSGGLRAGPGSGPADVW